MKEIIDIPYGLKEAFNHENEWTALLCVEMANCLNNGIVIPDNPTNGDVIKALFPNFKFNEEWKATRHFELQSEQGHIEITGIATSDWWNAPYKPQESEE